MATLTWPGRVLIDQRSGQTGPGGAGRHLGRIRSTGEDELDLARKTLASLLLRPAHFNDVEHRLLSFVFINTFMFMYTIIAF